MRGDLFQEIPGGTVFSVCTYGCYKRDDVPLCRKKSKIMLSHKSTPKGN